MQELRTAAIVQMFATGQTRAALEMCKEHGIYIDPAKVNPR